MNRWKKIGLTVGIGSAAIATMHIINKAVTASATAGNVTRNPKEEYYDWKLGKVAYTKQGEGSPLLLIHNVSAEGSSYEWKRIIKPLAAKHTVYTLDLLGCGHSEKPGITYTAFMYTQLINDFILNIIKKRVDIIASNDSSTMVLMSALNNPLAYNNVILINPQNIAKAGAGPDRKSKVRKHILDCPVIGTFIYNLCVSRSHINNEFCRKSFYNRKFINSDWLSAFYETAHICGANSKYLFTSKTCGYTAAAVHMAVKNTANITIITGRENPDAKEVTAQYLKLNPTIQTSVVVGSKLMPQLEQPLELYKKIKNALDD